MLNIKKKISDLACDIYIFANKQVRYRKIEKLLQSKMLNIGVGTYGYYNLDIESYRGSEAKVEIGNYTSLAPRINIITGGIHPVKSISQFPLRTKFKLPGAFADGNPSTRGDIKIGSDVWITSNVTILSGVTIGDGAVIGANSLVSRDVPPYAIAAGNPAVTIRYRFTEQQITELLKIKWWLWSEEKILSNVDMITGTEIDEFIKKFGV